MSNKFFHRQNGNRCYYCGVRVTRRATIDHVQPKSRGGKYDQTNWVTACRACNTKKANLTLDEFRALILAGKIRMPKIVKVEDRIVFVGEAQTDEI